MSDGDIALLVYATLACATNLQTKQFSIQVRNLLKRWASVIDDCGNGCIDLELEAHLESEEDRQQFSELLVEAERRIITQADKQNKVDFKQAILPITQQSIHFAGHLSSEQIKASFIRLRSLIAAG